MRFCRITKSGVTQVPARLLIPGSGCCCFDEECRGSAWSAGNSGAMDLPCTTGRARFLRIEQQERPSVFSEVLDQMH